MGRPKHRDEVIVPGQKSQDEKSYDEYHGYPIREVLKGQWGRVWWRNKAESERDLVEQFDLYPDDFLEEMESQELE